MANADSTTQSIAKSLENLITQAHAAPGKCVLYTTGAGINASTLLLGVPGASGTVMETRVPYDRFSTNEIVGYDVENYVSQKTAEDMAKAALKRAQDRKEPNVWGISCTGSIATNRPKKGDHRAIYTIASENIVVSHRITLDKGARTRTEEDLFISSLMLLEWCTALGLDVFETRASIMKNFGKPNDVFEELTM